MTVKYSFFKICIICNKYFLVFHYFVYNKIKCSLPVFAPVTITVLPESWAVLVHIPVVHFKYILKVNKDRNITLGIPRTIVKRISMGCIFRPEIII